ncbi:hypothetical protein RFN58_05880 [Streptomyces iakyrus]|uniref:hypothetical protein n=1 Tax=Streptomyces iakyrus TaxID=68219 RepID=UPI000A90D45D|nr:hypothetical protein [Streptomyces iakyrus]
MLTADSDLLALPGVHADHRHVRPARNGARDHVAVAVGLRDDLNVVLSRQQSGERSPHETGVLDEKNAVHGRSLSAVRGPPGHVERIIAAPPRDFQVGPRHG